MNISDKVTIGVLAILGCVAAFLVYKVNGVVNSPTVQQAVKTTVDYGKDVTRAAFTGNAPPTGTAGSNNDNNTLGVSYLESAHDLITHPVDSFKVIFGIGGD